MGEQRPQVSRRTVLRLAGGAGVAATVAVSGLGGGVARAGTRGAAAAPAGVSLPALSDLRGVQPPSQLNVTCPGAGRLTAWWNAGASPAGGLRYQVFVDDYLVATTAALTYAISGFTVGTPHTLSVASTDDTGAVSGRTAHVIRYVPGEADRDRAWVPAQLTAVAGLRGVALRWSDPPASVGGAPREYRVYRAGTDAPVAVLTGTGGSGPASSCFVTGSRPGVAEEYRVESWDGSRRLDEARNRVRVTSYTRAVEIGRAHV